MKKIIVLILLFSLAGCGYVTPEINESFEFITETNETITLACQPGKIKAVDNEIEYCYAGVMWIDEEIFNLLSLTEQANYQRGMQDRESEIVRDFNCQPK